MSDLGRQVVDVTDVIAAEDGEVNDDDDDGDEEEEGLFFCCCNFLRFVSLSLRCARM